MNGWYHSGGRHQSGPTRRAGSHSSRHDVRKLSFAFQKADGGWRCDSNTPPTVETGIALSGPRNLAATIHPAETVSVQGPLAAFKPGSFGPMPSDQSALRVQGLTKRFDRLAVDTLDLVIRPGEFYALLGPNGAGKTTTLRMVAGLLRPDAGAVSIFGIDALNDPVAAKQVTAWVSDEPMIYDKLTPLEYLEFIAGLWGVAPSIADACARQLLGSLGLEPNLHERCEGFSKGMRQKVALAGALIHDPRLIILDEPLTGLDAVSARHVKRLLGERVRAGNTVIMTTHILEVAERMADRIGVIASGRLVAEGTLAELRHQNGRNDTSLEDVFIALVDTQAAAA
jgi:ABC-2 type transport system ATP-binding protein